MPLRVCLTRSYCTGRVSFSHLNHLQATLEVSGRISDSSPMKFPWEKLSKILWPLWITPQNCACLVWPSMTITELRRKSSVTWKTSWILPMIRQYPGLWGKSCRHHPLLEGTLDPWAHGLHDSRIHKIKSKGTVTDCLPMWLVFLQWTKHFSYRIARGAPTLDMDMRSGR